jgi:hypothetical protein
MEPPSVKKAKLGLQGFSIDDILSHKTAAVMKEHEQMMKFRQVCFFSDHTVYIAMTGSIFNYLIFLVVFGT